MIDDAGTNHFLTLMIFMNYSCILKIGNSHIQKYIFPPGELGGGALPYMLYRYMHVPLWRVWFLSSLLWDRVYKSESFGLEPGIIFQDTDQLFKDFSLDKRDQQFSIKNNIMQICK